MQINFIAEMAKTLSEYSVSVGEYGDRIYAYVPLSLYKQTEPAVRTYDAEKHVAHASVNGVDIMTIMTPAEWNRED